MERNVIITVTDPDGTVIDIGTLTITNAAGDARDAARALAQAGPDAEFTGMPRDWER